MNKVGAVFAAVGVVALVVLLAIGAWHLGWFVKKADTNRESEVYQNSYGRQSALVQTVTDDVSEIADLDVTIATNPSPQLSAQRKALTDRVCSNAGLLTGTVPLSSSAAAFVAKECP